MNTNQAGAFTTEIMDDELYTVAKDGTKVKTPQLIDEFCLSDILNLTSTFIQAFMYHCDAENVLAKYKQRPRTDILYRKEELRKRADKFVEIKF